jgi:glutathione S-transferase
MLRLHHLPNSRSQRIVWLLEELQIPSEVIIHERGKQQDADAGLFAVHPLGKAPVIQDGDITLAESGAIIEYLLQTYGKGHLKPINDMPSWRDYLYWSHTAEASLMPYLATAQVFRRVELATPWPARFITQFLHYQVAKQYLKPNLLALLQLADQHLAKHRYFAGTFGPCDVVMEFMLNALVGSLVSPEAVPHISQWLLQVQSRDTYKNAQKIGHWNLRQFRDYWRFLRNY